MMLKSAWRAGGRISANFQYNIQLQILSIGNLNKNVQKNILKFVQLFLKKIAQKKCSKMVIFTVADRDRDGHQVNTIVNVNNIFNKAEVKINIVGEVEKK